MLAVVVVRDGVLPAGADEAVAECGGRGLLAGDGAGDAVAALHGVAAELTIAECGAFKPAAFAAALAPLVADEPVIVLPASPDGRDLAPHLAARLKRPALLNATMVTPRSVTLVRRGGRDMHVVTPPAEFVSTLATGVRGSERHRRQPPAVRVVDIAVSEAGDAEVLGVLPPDAATVDLAEAGRIVAGGAGLDSEKRFAQLAELGGMLDASVGATRVITDRQWIEHERQIGTTGVVVDPELYVAFGISGAVQHTSGLGDPAHIISVNTDAHCPMMQMADLAVVADANDVLDELLALLRSPDE
jgi:electron transfer flavoprotein alpha subunit